MTEKIKELAEIFQIPGELKCVKTISYGNINSTYDVTFESEGVESRYIFQKLNVFVFKNPLCIMKNISLITEHISKKLDAAGDSRDKVMHFLCNRDGKNYYMDSSGEDFWRVSEYVPNSFTVNDGSDLDKMRSAGRAFGKFQIMLSDFDPSLLGETIPDFHNTRKRIALLEQHYGEDICRRACEVKSEFDMLEEFKDSAVFFNKLLDENAIPMRVTHNDTKINNVLFDTETGEAKTVIDLDTVMPGLVAYDFGDAVRYAANRADENERDISKVVFDIDCFRAFAEGFIPEIAKSLTEIEIKTLPMGAFVMTAELAVRFLDDYLVGDKYFKITYPEHNLNRARVQLELARQMLAHMDEMNEIVREINIM